MGLRIILASCATGLRDSTGTEIVHETVNAIIVGGHVNAHTVVHSLKSIRFGGKIILLRADQEPRGLASFCHPDVEVWRVPLEKPGDLLAALDARFGKTGEKTAVFFTDERFHLALADTHPDERPWLIVHIGAWQQSRIILDRLLFCQFLAGAKIADVPRTIDGSHDPLAVFGSSFILRPRYSWHDLSRHESVRLVSSNEEYDCWMADFKSRGLGINDVCYQELLSIRDEDNVSICGWYDRDRQHLICTHKVLQHPPRTGNGDVVARCDAPPGVMETALRILRALDYAGPLELEFVFDEKSNRYQVIELNPRFWMQHGLVEVVTGFALTASYLGLPPLTPTPTGAQTRYWVNPLYAVFRCLKGDFRAVRYAHRPDACLPFSFWQAVRFAPIHVWNRLTSRN